MYIYVLFFKVKIKLLKMPIQLVMKPRKVYTKTLPKKELIFFMLTFFFLSYYSNLSVLSVTLSVA